MHERFIRYYLQFFELPPKEEKRSPQVGFEPTTNRLTADRSTTELLRKNREGCIPETLKEVKGFIPNRVKCTNLYYMEKKRR